MPKFRFTEIAINSTEKKKPVEEDKFTYIGLEHLDSGTLTVSRWGSDIAPIGEKLVMKKGDVLFGKRRAYQKKVGIAPFDGIFSAHGMVLRPREEVITKEYFPLFISSDYFLNEAIRISVGSLSPTVNWKDLKDLEFTIPLIEEQKRITPLIWAAIEAKNAYKEQIRCTDDLVKSQFIEMFGDPNNNANTVSFETAFTIRDDLRKPINDSVRSEMHENAMYPYYGANGQVDTINQYLMDCTALCLAEDCGAYGAGEASSYIVSGKCWVNNHAHVINGADEMAFQCYSKLAHGSVTERKKRGLPTKDTCTTPIIPKWKMELIAHEIFTKHFTDISAVTELACKMIEEHINDVEDVEDNTEIIAQKNAEIEKLERKKVGLIEMRADGDIERDYFLTRKDEVEKQIEHLQQEIQELTPIDTRQKKEDLVERLEALKQKLSEYTDFENTLIIPDGVIEAFTEQIIASDKGFDWYLKAVPDMVKSFMDDTPDDETEKEWHELTQFDLTIEDAKAYVYSFSSRRRVHGWQNIKIRLFV